MGNEQRVHQLVDRIEHEARICDLDPRYAAGLIWLEEGAEQNAYAKEEWAEALASLADTAGGGLADTHVRAPQLAEEGTGNVNRTALDGNGDEAKKRVRTLAKEEGISRAEAEQRLYDEGVIA
jgi:hypothetical protein